MNKTLNQTHPKSASLSKNSGISMAIEIKRNFFILGSYCWNTRAPMRPESCSKYTSTARWGYEPRQEVICERNNLLKWWPILRSIVMRNTLCCTICCFILISLDFRQLLICDVGAYLTQSLQIGSLLKDLSDIHVPYFPVLGWLEQSKNGNSSLCIIM